MDGADHQLARRKENDSRSLHEVLLVFQVGYKQASHLIKVRGAVKASNLFQVPKDKWHDYIK